MPEGENMKAMGKGSVSSFLTVLLGAGWYAVALGIALVSCLVVLLPFINVPGMKVTIPVSFTVDARAHNVKALDTTEAQGQNIRIGGAPGFGFEIGDESADRNPQIHVRGSLRFPTQSRAFFGGNAVLLLVFLALLLGVLGQLRAVFRTLRDGQPFVQANATRIRWIGFAVIVIELAGSATVFFENYYAMTHFSAEGLRFDAWPAINAFAIIDGVIILVIAEVFRAGTRLDEEQSLTV
jgi:hypothetical protein